MSKHSPTRTYCKLNRPLPYYHPKCRMPRHWTFTQDHRTTQPPPLSLVKRALIAYSVFFKTLSKSIYTSNMITAGGQGGLKRKNY